MSLDFDIARGQMRIARPLWPLADVTLYFEDVLITNVTGRAVSVWCELWIENSLRQSVAVAQIDEDESAEVTPSIDPSAQRDVLADVVEAKRPAGQPAYHRRI